MKGKKTPEAKAIEQTADTKPDPQGRYFGINLWCDENLHHYTDAQLSFLQQRVKSERNLRHKGKKAGRPTVEIDPAALRGFFDLMRKSSPRETVIRALAKLFDCSARTIERKLKPPTK